MAEETVLAALGAVFVALVFWMVTNWNVVRVGRSIKADIDAKRAASEAHFDLELAKLNERLDGFAERVDAPIDMTAIVSAVQENVEAIVPRVRESVKGMMDGAAGYTRKAIKALGEDVAERVGEEVAGSAPNMEAVLMTRLQRLRLDEEWAKQNPVAAFGLETLRTMLLGDSGALGGLSPSSSPARTGSTFKPGL